MMCTAKGPEWPGKRRMGKNNLRKYPVQKAVPRSTLGNRPECNHCMGLAAAAWAAGRGSEE